MNLIPKMRLYIEYALIAMVLLGGCTSVTYYFKSKVLKGQVEQAQYMLDLSVEPNRVTELSIVKLRNELKVKEEAILMLQELHQAAELRAKKASDNFRRLRDADTTVRDWANQPLPDVMRQRPDSGGAPD